MTDQAKMWRNLLLRLQTAAYRECRGHGLAVVSVKLVICDGELVRWSKPVVSHTEPAGRGAEVPVELLNDEAIEALTSS